ncbi:YolD-like family protein [Oceanobacillus kimchii]|uniref:YolD-like family protein n=1 Tax=Oceanobacillus kimchii TaxID=746691 RepID=UPI0003477C24|nr:YolD-like family protein [Oceanobacillus kimchii]
MNDRGSIKWTAMMLPEHVEYLRKKKKEAQKISKPVIDNQQFDYMEQQLQYATINNSNIIITYYNDGEIQTITCQTSNIKVTKEYLQLNIGNGTIELPVNNLLNIESE